jgi:hypothetical protein
MKKPNQSLPNPKPEKVQRVSCQEVCATSCSNCRERCLRECHVAKKDNAGSCKQIARGCCDECKDDCVTVCDLCANS